MNKLTGEPTNRFTRFADHHCGDARPPVSWMWLLRQCFWLAIQLPLLYAGFAIAWAAISRKLAGAAEPALIGTLALVPAYSIFLAWWMTHTVSGLIDWLRFGDQSPRIVLQAHPAPALAASHKSSLSAAPER